MRPETEELAPAEVFREQLRRHREARGWSQHDLGEATGLGRQGIARLENSGPRAREPRLTELLLIAAVLEVPPAALWVPLWTTDTDVAIAIDARLEPLSPGTAAAWVVGEAYPRTREEAAVPAPWGRRSGYSPEGRALDAFRRASPLAHELSRLVIDERRFDEDPEGAGAEYLRTHFPRELARLADDLDRVGSGRATPPPLHAAVARALEQHAAGLGHGGVDDLASEREDG